jgi:hypothetical protein
MQCILFIVEAFKKSLAKVKIIITCDSFFFQELLKKVLRKSKYDVSEVQFCSGRDTLVAVASNDKVKAIIFLNCVIDCKTFIRVLTLLHPHFVRVDFQCSVNLFCPYD